MKTGSPVAYSVEERGNSQEVPALTEIIAKVYILESSGGKNVNCPQGKYNGFGYRQNKSEWVCYDTQEEVFDLVGMWFSNKLEKGYSLNEALCYYQSGVRSDSCIYADKFNSI